MLCVRYFIKHIRLLEIKALTFDKISSLALAQSDSASVMCASEAALAQLAPTLW